MSPDDAGPDALATGPGPDRATGRRTDLDAHAEVLLRLLADEARRMDPTDPLDSALTLIQARTDTEVAARSRHWFAPLVAAAGVLALVLVGALVWPHLGSHAPVGTTSTGPRPSTAPPTASPSPPPSPSPSPSGTGTGTPAPAASVPVYFGGTYAGRTMLYREFHRTAAAALASAVEAMLAEPFDADYASLGPSGTSLLGLTRNGSVVTVTLSSPPSLTATGPGGYGATSVQEVVYTVTAVDRPCVLSPSPTPAAGRRQ